MKREITLVVSYGPQAGTGSEYVSTVGLHLPRIPALGENLVFEGRLLKGHPVQLYMGVTGVDHVYGYGKDFHEFVDRTEIEAVCARDIGPEVLAGVLMEYPFVKWIDHNDGKGPQYPNREIPV